jgi:hypothetical protein
MAQVLCPVGSSCMVVGNYNTATGSQGLRSFLLAESGASWNVIKPPLPSGASADAALFLSGGVCASASSCIVTGAYNLNAASYGDPLILSGHGSSWTPTKAPLPAGGDIAGNVGPVTCLSATECLVVGDYLDTGGQDHGLILTGAGTSWSPMTAPLPQNASATAPGLVDLDAAACASASSCAIGGSYTDTAGALEPVLISGPLGDGSAGTPPSASQLSVKTSVATQKLTSDPGSDAAVKLTIRVTNPDGTPAKNATVKLSNAKPTATFHTDKSGTLTIIEPVSVGNAANSSVSVTVTVQNTAGLTGSATQILYEVSRTVTCSKSGIPESDADLFLDSLPDRPPGIGSWIGIVYYLVHGGPEVHTTIGGYTITVPSSKTLYAESVKVTQGSKTIRSFTLYSSQALVSVPTGALDQMQSGCSSTSLA